MHTICQGAIFNCIEKLDALKIRFNKIQGSTPFEKRAEESWLISCLETWFMKKWCTKRGTTLKRIEVGPDYWKKRRLSNMCECGKEKVCPDCEDLNGRVMKVKIVMLLIKLKLRE